MKTLLIALVLSWAPWAWADRYQCTDCMAEIPGQPLGPHFFSSYLPYEQPLLTINTPSLSRDARAKVCTRNDNVVDTVVFHHSDTPVSATVYDLNDAHLNRSSAGDPWYMLAYHYVINTSYSGQNNVATQVSQGRPFNITGAHAGHLVYHAASAETVTALRQPNAVVCHVGNAPMRPASDIFRNGQALANYNTVGVVVVGNYARYSADNPQGYPRNQPRYMSSAGVEAAGRLICQLQRQHPRIRNVSWHRAYKPTACPGNIISQIEAIKNVARRLGCSFN